MDKEKGSGVGCVSALLVLLGAVLWWFAPMIPLAIYQWFKK